MCKGLCDQSRLYVLQNIGCLASSQSKKKQKRKKHLWHFHFALTCRHRGYDGQLPVYFRSSATPVSLLLHNVLSWVAAPQKSDQ